MAKDTIKMAGPDTDGNYKVITTKGTLRVRPGEVYTEAYVKSHLLSSGAKMKLEVTFIEPKFEGIYEEQTKKWRSKPAA